MSAQPQVVILGAGLTGLSTALHLRARPCLLVEREDRVGGKAKSERKDGFTFDVTGHWLHLRDERTKRLVANLFGPGDLAEIERRTGVWTHGTMLAYPFQANLFGLPLVVVQECLVEFVDACARAAAGTQPPVRTFEEFAIARFGRGIARHFFVPYNTKLWGEPPDRHVASWIARYVPVPDVAQVVGGAIGLRQEGLGYNARFLYPAKGGIDALPEAILREVARTGGVDVRLGTDVEEIDVERKTVKLTRIPEPLPYTKLVSTMPLPELVDRIPGAPPQVREARSLLRWVRWRWLDVATRTPPPMPEHWVYVPEPDVPFFRVGAYTNAMATMAPPGCGALYVELTDRDRPPNLREIHPALARMGALTRPEDVVFCETRDIEYAYVVFDDAHERATRTILEWLSARSIRSCGRYGAWVYSSMEDGILDGMEAAAWASPS
jgi:protoporphyrinogen oxidase